MSPLIKGDVSTADRGMVTAVSSELQIVSLRKNDHPSTASGPPFGVPEMREHFGERRNIWVIVSKTLSVLP